MRPSKEGFGNVTELRNLLEFTTLVVFSNRSITQLKL